MSESDTKFRFLLCCMLSVCGLLSAKPSLADSAQILTNTNTTPIICAPVLNALVSNHDYFSPDPGLAKALHENNLSLSVVSRIGVYSPSWKRLLWNEFRDDDPDKYSALLDTEQYDHTYVVYRSAADLYGEGQLQPIYKLVHMRSAVPPKLFLLDDNLGISKGFNSLDASDIILNGLRGYPIVRRAGHIQVFEIDTDKLGEAWTEKKFIANLFCDFSLPPDPGAAATKSDPREATNKPSETADQVPTISGASAPTPATVPTAPTLDPCATYQTSNPAYYSACEDRLTKLQRLNSGGGQK